MTGLSDRATEDELLATARGSGLTVCQSAETAGISERTARRRLTEPRIEELVEQVRADRLEALTDRLVDLGWKALAALEDLLADTQPGSIRLRAASTLFESVREIQDRELILDRLVALEESATQSSQTAAQKWG